MLTPYDSIAAFNNQAIDTMREGCVDSLASSMSLFQRSILLVFRVLDEGVNTSPMLTATMPQQAVLSPVSSSQLLPSPSSSSSSSVRCNPSGAEEEPVYFSRTNRSTMAFNETAHITSDFSSHDLTEQVFLQPIYMFPSSTGYSEDTFISIAVASKIVLFNLAIVHHRWAMLRTHAPCSREQRGVWMANHLTQALTFYQRALSIPITREHITNGCQAVLQLVTMALHNNMARITHILGNFSESTCHFEQLRRFALSLNVDSYDSDTAMLLNWHKSIFLTNAIVFSVPPSAAAA